MTSYLYRMPAGIVGDINRAEHATVETALQHATKYATSYGIPIKFVAGKVAHVESGDDASVVAGFIVRPYPTGPAVNNEAEGVATPPASGPVDVLTRGYIIGKLARGTAVRRGAVFVRVTADTGKLVGDIEDAADSGKCVAIPGCYFMGAADANGIVEIAYNI